MLGIWLSGGIAVPLGASLPLPEKSYMLKDAGVTTLLATRKTLACMRPLERDVSVGAHKCTLLLPDIIKKAHGHHALGNHGRHGEDTPDFSYPPLGEDVEESWMPTYFGGGAGEGSLLLYTSGTTGRPKGVLHTHGSILAQTQQLCSLTSSCPFLRQCSNSGNNIWNSWVSRNGVFTIRLTLTARVPGRAVNLPPPCPSSFLPCLSRLFCSSLPNDSAVRDVDIPAHIHGLVNALLTPLHAGATVDFLPKFDAGAVWDRIIECNSGHGPPPQQEAAEEGGGTSRAITVFTAVPTMYARLIEAYDRMGVDEQALARQCVSSLRLMISGSAACPLPILKRWEEISGHRLLERYGMTETGMVLSNPLHGERKIGHVGFPMPGVTVRIRPADNDAVDSAVLADDGARQALAEAASEKPAGTNGEVHSGELLVRGESVFDFYWGREMETSDAFDVNGYFRTGDLVSVDAAGSYKILGRISVDIIKTGGFKVSALEVEDKLLEHEAIGECAVVGIPDATYGQMVAAIVAPREGFTCPELPLLQQWARERLEDCKVPRRLLVVGHIPRNGMGKVNKKELLKMFEQSETHEVAAAS
eukprot:jgi/Mesvir1/23068/Mv10595-RA.1